MPTLDAGQVRTRKLRDAAGCSAINASSFPVVLTGYHSREDAVQKRRPVSLDSADPPDVYRLRCDFPTLRAPGVELRGVEILINLDANGDYPGTWPASAVVSDPKPFAPHIGADGSICHGHFVWIAFRTQLPEYVRQLCRLLNFDETNDPRTTFMNKSAAAHWSQTMKHRPLDPNLRFPIVDLDGSAGRVRPLTRVNTPRRRWSGRVSP